MKILITIILNVLVNLQSHTLQPNVDWNTVIVEDPQELLKCKKWNIQGKSADLYFEYTDTKEFLYIEGTLTSEKSYYISDTKCFEKVFDKNNVGQSNKGRFLVTEDNCYYITVINDSTIQISYLSDEKPTTTTLIAKL